VTPRGLNIFLGVHGVLAVNQIMPVVLQLSLEKGEGTGFIFL
jgi:hypothetical protein